MCVCVCVCVSGRASGRAGERRGDRAGTRLPAQVGKNRGNARIPITPGSLGGARGPLSAPVGGNGSRASGLTVIGRAIGAGRAALRRIGITRSEVASAIGQMAVSRAGSNGVRLVHPIPSGGPVSGLHNPRGKGVLTYGIVCSHGVSLS